MFRIIRNSTTADAADMNDNFYHIGQGSIMPMVGNYLYSTDSSCNLGSATYKWNNGFIDNLDCGTLNYSTITTDKTWGLLYEIDSSVYTLSSRIELSVATKEYSEFVIRSSLNNNTTTVLLHLNGDSSGSYQYTHTIFYGGSYSSYNVTTTGIEINDPSLIRSSNIHIYAKNGSRRIIDWNSAWDFGSYFWSNTSSTITSLVITNLETSASVMVYGR